jgi:hypothetical protein
MVLSILAILVVLCLVEAGHWYFKDREYLAIVDDLQSQLPPGTSRDEARGYLRGKGWEPKFWEQENKLNAVREFDTRFVFFVIYAWVELPLDEDYRVKEVRVGHYQLAL